MALPGRSDLRCGGELAGAFSGLWEEVKAGAWVLGKGGPISWVLEGGGGWELWNSGLSKGRARDEDCCWVLRKRCLFGSSVRVGGVALISASAERGAERSGFLGSYRRRGLVAWVLQKGGLGVDSFILEGERSWRSGFPCA